MGLSDLTSPPGTLYDRVMTYRPACEAAQARQSKTFDGLAFDEIFRRADPDRGLKCWACNGRHATIRLVQECHADLYDYEQEREAEAYAEGAYSRYLERRSYGYDD